MLSFFKCFCPFTQNEENEPYERRLVQLNNIRDLIEEGKFRDAAVIVRDVSEHLIDIANAI